MNKRKAFIPITALMAALLLALVAAMTPFAERDVAHADGLHSADATLASLVVAGGPSGTNVVSDSSAPVTTENFTGRIVNADSGVTVTATATQAGQATEHHNSIIRINGEVVASGTAKTVTVTAGTTRTISIVVQAPDRSVTKTYTVKVYRENQTKSTNANLASLGLSEVSISPGFSSGTTSYKARIRGESVTLSYGLSDNSGGASARVDITDNDSGSSYDADTKKVTLANESYTTTITVLVTPESVTVDSNNTCDTAGIKCYAIEVYRIRNNASTVATLGTLTLSASSGGGFADNNNIDLGANDFTARVTNLTEHVVIAASTTDRGASFVITPSDSDGDTTDHEIDLSAGVIRTITVKVTAEDPTSTKTYTLTVYRLRSTVKTDANMGALSVSKGSMSPAFSKTTTAYTVRGVGPNDTELTINATPSDVGASVAFAASGGNAAVDSSGKVTLAAAGTPTVVTATVTAENGSTTKDYVVTIIRPRSLPSADTSLATLSIAPVGGAIADGNNIDLANEDFDARVTTATTHVTVSATANASASGATVAVSPTGQIPLTAGKTTTITVTVTAEDGTTTQDFKITVYRERATESKDATLSALSLSAGTLSPAFSSDRMDYKARVANSVGEVTVSYTLNDNEGGASVVVDDAAVTGSNPACPTSNVSGPKDISLAPGVTTTITLCVTPEAGAGLDPVNGNLKFYVIKVFRARANPSTDATLSTFAITDANPASSTNILTNESVLTADLDVGYRVRTVNVIATPSDNSGGAMVNIVSPPDKDATTSDHEIDLTAGAETTITVEVMAEDASVATKTYTAKVYRQNFSKSDDAMLSSLELSGVTLTPDFNPATKTYTGTAVFSAEKTTITAMTNHKGAGLEFPADADADMDGKQFALTTAGAEYTITLKVTPESKMTEANTGLVTIPTADTDKTIYNIKVTRAAAASTDATLSSLSLMAGADAVALTPAFAADTTSYTAMVGSDVESVNVNAMATHLGAAVTGNTGMQSLDIGENTLSVVVTAEDEETSMTYTIMVTREELTPAKRLLGVYDANRDNSIDIDEVSAALDDYFDGDLSADDLSIIIDLYFG